MGDDLLQDTDNIQTQTQKSQVDWSQPNTPSFIPNIWGRLYSTKVSLNDKHCWKDTDKEYPPYYGKNIFMILLTRINSSNYLQNLNTFLIYYPKYCFTDLIQPDFTLGRALTCSFVMRKDIIKENIVKSVSKQHFVIKRNLL